jgi:hypothetical protein
MTQNEESYTILDVLTKLRHVQEMKLLFLQGITINIHEDITIHNIVHEKELIKILDRYRDHYDDVMKYNDTITIFNLDKNSYLRVGLQKQILRFMIPYL